MCVPQNKGAAVVSPSIPAGFGEVKAKEEERLTHKFWWMGVWVKARSLHIEGCNLASPTHKGLGLRKVLKKVLKKALKKILLTQKRTQKSKCTFLSTQKSTQ